MSPEKMNPIEKFSLFDEHWSPKIAGELNGQHVKPVKLLDEFVIVPRGVEHRPVAEEEAHVMLFEPATTLNTGNVRGGMTQQDLDRV